MTAHIGLTSLEAQKRLAADGPNELPLQKPRSLIQVALATLREPMFAMLLVAGVIYLLLGSLEEALLLLAFACTSVGITIVQEERSERMLGALRELTSPRALVVRDGQRLRIPSRALVRGDLIVLSEGDRIAADAIVREGSDLQVDESLLTGESVAVRKRAAQDPAPPPAPPGGEDLPWVFSSTLIVRGAGVAEVTATGAASRIGQIGKALAGIETATPRLTLETRHIVRVIAGAGALCCLVVVILFGLFRGSWLQALLAGIALGMSMLPEEFPLVLAVFTVMGAWRLSQARVLTRRAAAIETLGAATVLCTDKTGTLTQNRMTIAQIRAGGEIFDVQAGRMLSPAIADAVAFGAMASAVEPFDPMEKAFHALRDTSGGAVRAAGDLAKVYPLRPELLAVTHAWAEEGAYAVAAKGAPEAIIGLCRLDGAHAAQIKQEIDAMAAAGMRVLGVAVARHATPALPDHPAAFDFRFAGLVGLADPVRPGVTDALQECQAAGIRVIMITGDYPLTARAIAVEAGMTPGRIVTGAELAAMSDADFAAALTNANIFARIMPDQKLRLVQALQKNGEVVAMTGDGVNDAPALRAADIGVAMGNRGTDVAREAAAIVLLDDDFASVVRTVRLGRRIYDNLRKAMGYIIAVHIPIAGMALLPLLTGLPLVFAPVHIAFLEMIIDPICSIMFEAEAEEADVMRRPPRSPLARLLSAGLIRWSLLQGGLALGIVAAIYLGGYRLGMADADLRTLTFIALVCGNLGLVLVNRSFAATARGLLRGAGRVFWTIAALVIGLLALALSAPPVRRLFAFGAFHGHDMLVVVAATALLIGLLEVIKKLWPRQFRTALAA